MGCSVILDAVIDGPPCLMVAAIAGCFAAAAGLWLLGRWLSR